MRDLSKRDIRRQYLQERIDLFTARIHVTDRGKAQIITDATFYFEQKYIAPFVRHPDGSPPLLCHHKIIAATCAAIMAVMPFRAPKTESRYDAVNLRLNAAFAFDVAAGILSDWLEPEGHTVYRRALWTTYEEHQIWLAGIIPPRQHEPEKFPYFLISQFWSAVEVACRPFE
ncbi:hypothetical protein FACS1894107_07790 [Planctomycetales bacterium]|nr:hypothetical protein FACS1894107_07790 [Planctomycetales bacterium]GHS99947.1 hypothetical protein FACS1894108_10930 [Planctomycetales bacterium]